MKAGTAKRTITPDKDRVVVFGQMSRGTVKDIQARCLVLNDGKRRMVIVTYDLNCLDVATPILRERCEDELGIGTGYFVPLATHNHNAPIQIVPGNFDYGRWLADTIFDMIQQAIANEQGGVKLRFGHGQGYFARCVGSTAVDYEIQLLGAYKDGKPLAVLFTHPVHPLQGTEFGVEPGHPGYACELLEERLPGCLALYADACGGNQYPVELPGDGGPMDAAVQLGAYLADMVRGLASGVMFDVTGDLHSTFDIVSLPLVDPISHDEAKTLANEAQCEKLRVPYPDDHRPTNWIRVLLHYHENNLPFPKRLDELVCTDEGFLVREDEFPDNRRYPCRYEEVIVSRIGPMAFVAMQGEVCAPIGMRIKDAFRQYFPIMVTAYMGEHNLYIPTRELVRQNAYQAQVLQIQYGCPVGFDPDVEDVMTNAVTAKIREVMDHRQQELFEQHYLAVRRGRAFTDNPWTIPS